MRRTRPSEPQDQWTCSAYIFGAVCPKHGKGATLVMPFCNTHAMNKNLTKISHHVAYNAHTVLILDQAGWHMTNNLRVPDNISFVILPPKSPEINPMENIWQFMCENCLSNCTFKTYDNIVEICCYTWQKLIVQPWTIISIQLPE